MCQYSMRLQYEHYKMCVLNVTSPAPGVTWFQACGSSHKRATELCHSCCDENNCNYGTCAELNSKIDINTFTISN